MGWRTGRAFVYGRERTIRWQESVWANVGAFRICLWTCERRAWRRELLRAEIQAGLHPSMTEVEIQALTERLVSLTA